VAANPTGTHGQETKPNIVFILADNVGWGDIGCYGGTAPTPRIDALASQGLRSKNYNIEAQCTPTRSAILTGRLPVRTGCYSIPLPGQGEYGLAPWEYTIGELFSDAGYATALHGKWHVGEADGRLPIDQGFDEWFGIKNTSDESGYSSYPLFAESGFPAPKIWEGVKGSKARPVDDFNLRARPLMDEQITGRTVEFIKRNAAAKKPFFVYVGLTQMHPPLIHHPDFTGKSGGGTYSDTLAELDYRTGQILDAIDTAGIADNTIVVWSSDNAAIALPATGGSNGPWRGAFASGFEGGMRYHVGQAALARPKA
jgi:arylsulfatase